MEQNIKENKMESNSKENTAKTYSIEEILNIINESAKNKKPLPEDVEMLLKTLNSGENEKENKYTKNQSMGNISYTEGLSLDDIKAINDYAYKQTENYTKTPFNMENPEHREYFEYFKAQAYKNKEKEMKLKKFDESLHEKYGDMYESVEKAARNTFESMAFKDARDIISSRMHGNVEKLLLFYDSVFNEMVAKQKQMEEMPAKTEEGSIIFPPKAIKGGNFKADKNIKTYENFI